MADLKVYLSHGGGVNSWALYLYLIEQGEVPGEDFEAVFVNHGTDWPETYEYLDMMLVKGYPVTVLRPESKYGATVEERCFNRRIIPYKGKRWCTQEYKVDVLKAYYKIPCIELVGIDAGETHRATGLAGKTGVEQDFPLISAGIDRQGCIDIIRRHGLPIPPKSGCYICLAGETEVITREGVKPIRDIVGKATLLVPRKQSCWGDWAEAEVRSFGVQRLMRINLRRYRAKKTIYATAEHRWVIKEKNGRWKQFIMTKELKPGDVLASCRHVSILVSKNPVKPSHFGIAHGFTYGDGTLEKNTNRPVSVQLFKHKIKTMLPYFSMCNPREVTTSYGDKVLYVYNLPRQWKESPPLNECRSYLLGWLAGYFAADGHVSKDGQATISSAEIESLKLVRDVCYILGVQTSPITTKQHPAINGRIATLHSVNLYTRDLPDSFWLHEHHLERIKRQHDNERERRQDWVVESVEWSDREEEVFCAIVPGREMFTLADNIVTGNCPFQSRRQWIELREKHPELFCKAKRLEELCNERRAASGKKPVYFRDRPLEELIQVKDNRGRLAIPGQIDMFDDFDRPPCRCGL